MPAFARDTETAAAVAVRLPVTLSAGLTGAALALSFVSGALASYFMGRRTSRMKPVDILRRL
jgi:ABC-type antimicrobial peptide transport system permease subunit